jgi:hypothetical protein
MSFRVFDVYCPTCQTVRKDEVLDVDSTTGAVAEPPICACGEVMERMYSSCNFAFGDAFFYGMGPRNIEVQYEMEDGRKIVKNLTKDVHNENSKKGKW